MTVEAQMCDEDVFNREAVCNARTVDDRLRELAPVVRLSGEQISVIGRYEHVTAALQDWRAFSSRSRPWHDPDSVRPEILLVDDPPRHTLTRGVVSATLTPAKLGKLASRFQADADSLIRGVVERSAEPLDVVAHLTQAFVYKVLPDALGLPQAGREHLYAFGHMVWATLGPQNELFREAMEGTAPVIAWVEQCCNRENLDPDGLGMQMFRAADAGQVTLDEAKLLVQVLLSAAADTTVMTLATALRAFSVFPEQYELLRAQPQLLRNAFEESLRWDSPSRMAGRITTRDVELGGYRIAAGERCGLLFAAANRDPRKWPQPDRFDIRRDLKGHVGWGYGVHACVGRVLALLEADALLGACIRHIERFEPAGEPVPWMSAIGHGPARLPLRVVPAAASSR
ncbi:MAG: cytochrome P450 [Steroidobacteraceae bacterium]